MLETVYLLAEKVLSPARMAGRVIATLSLAVIALAYIYEVMMRYLFASPTWWSAELVAYLLCVLVFSMMPHVTATRGQVAVTMMLERMPAGARQMIERGIWSTGALVCGAMAWFAGNETWRQFSRGIQMMAAQPIPKWWVSVWIAVGFALASAEFVRLALAPRSAAAALTNGMRT